MSRVRRLCLSGTVVAVTASLLAAVPESATAATTRAAPALDRVLAQQFHRSSPVPGIAARVDAPGLHWAAAVGSSDRVLGVPLRPTDTFRIASITKTFTAAAILTLVDQRRVVLDAPIAGYLPPPYPTLLREGGYRPDLITVRHLLTHTSGLYDYATDGAFIDTAVGDLHHRWTPVEQVKWAMTHGRPYGVPGGQFHYSDTGYVLLARILESVTGLPQARTYRQLLQYDRLGLTASWFETLEPAPPGAGTRAHQYLIDTAHGIDIDSYAADPSLDLYGGGGLVSSVADLNTFYRALFEGHVISRSSLRAMRTVMPTGDGDEMAGMGIFAKVVAGYTCWWHNGFWGSAAVFCPDHRLAVSVTTNAFIADRSVPGALTDAVVLATTAIGLLEHRQH